MRKIPQKRYAIFPLTYPYKVIFDRIQNRTLLIEGTWNKCTKQTYEKEILNHPFPNSNRSDDLNLSTIVVNMTEACNLRCKYCSRFHRDYSPINMTSDIFKIVLRRCVELATHYEDKVVVQFHGGEPLLCLNVIEEGLKDIPIDDLNKLDLRIQTNGTLVDEKFFDLCKCYNIHIGLSIDGPPHISDLNRVGANGKPVGKIVEKSMRLIRKYIDRSHVSCLCVLSSGNVHKADAVFDYMIKMGIEDFSILPLYPDYSCIQNCREITPKNREMFEFSRRIFDRWIEWLRQGHILCIPSFQIWIWNLLSGNSKQPLSHTSCGMAQAMVFVDTDGSVYGCGPFSYYPETCFGNLTKEGFLSIKELEGYRRFAERKTENVSDCTLCGLQGVCRGGCPANAYLQTGSIVKKDPFCEYWQRIIGYILEKIAEDYEILELVPSYTIRL